MGTAELIWGSELQLNPNKITLPTQCHNTCKSVCVKLDQQTMASSHLYKQMLFQIKIMTKIIILLMWYINIQTLQNLINVFVKTTEEKKETVLKECPHSVCTEMRQMKKSRKIKIMKNKRNILS